VACGSKPSREITRAYYFWKSNFSLQSLEKNSLHQHGVKKIYLKYFDIAESETNHPTPVAQVNFQPETKKYILDSGIELVPVVFVTNQSLDSFDSVACHALGVKIVELVNAISRQQDITSVRQIQIDCDWTRTTRSNFFALLQGVRSELNAGQILSATIRLHQLKYKTSTGIPPVDRGALMCYNMGNLRDPESKNSILDIEEMKRYIGSLDTYELPLDIALPIFDWKVLFRNNTYAGLISSLPDSSLKGSALRKSGNRFEFLRDSSIDGYDFRKGDWLRVEGSPAKSVRLAEDLINSKLPHVPVTVILYHLDSLNLIKYNPNELEDIFDRLR
jgi:hypothetical protein